MSGHLCDLGFQHTEGNSHSSRLVEISKEHRTDIYHAYDESGLPILHVLWGRCCVSKLICQCIISTSLCNIVYTHVVWIFILRENNVLYLGREQRIRHRGRICAWHFVFLNTGAAFVFIDLFSFTSI